MTRVRESIANAWARAVRVCGNLPGSFKECVCLCGRECAGRCLKERGGASGFAFARRQRRQEQRQTSRRQLAVAVVFTGDTVAKHQEVGWLCGAGATTTRKNGQTGWCATGKRGRCSPGTAAAAGGGAKNKRAARASGGKKKCRSIARALFHGVGEQSVGVRQGQERATRAETGWGGNEIRGRVVWVVHCLLVVRGRGGGGGRGQRAPRRRGKKESDSASGCRSRDVWVRGFVRLGLVGDLRLVAKRERGERRIGRRGNEPASDEARKERGKETRHRRARARRHIPSPSPSPAVSPVALLLLLDALDVLGLQLARRQRHGHRRAAAPAAAAGAAAGARASPAADVAVAPAHAGALLLARAAARDAVAVAAAARVLRVGGVDGDKGGRDWGGGFLEGGGGRERGGEGKAACARRAREKARRRRPNRRRRRRFSPEATGNANSPSRDG